MNELTLDGKIYVSSRQAAEITGYAKDYIGQMCREGRVEARLVGRNWYVLKSAIEKHRFAVEEAPVEEEIVPELPAAASWEQPRYQPEVIPDLPSINRLAEPVVEVEELEIAAPESVLNTLEAMQDAWKGWFTRDASDISLEAQNATEEEDAVVPIHSLHSHADQHEALNLRRIREYRIEEEKRVEEDDEVIADSPREGKSSNYLVVRTGLIVITLVAIGIGCIGSGLLSSKFVSYKPISLIAGVSLYTQTR